MLIHSVTPPHMLNEEPSYPEMSTRRFGGGFLEGIDTPQGFRVMRLLSTDPGMYLDKNYMPGSIMNN